MKKILYRVEILRLTEEANLWKTKFSKQENNLEEIGEYKEKLVMQKKRISKLEKTVAWISNENEMKFIKMKSEIEELEN